jgi:hypothetical protein
MTATYQAGSRNPALLLRVLTVVGDGAHMDDVLAVLTKKSPGTRPAVRRLVYHAIEQGLIIRAGDGLKLTRAGLERQVELEGVLRRRAVLWGRLSHVKDI